MKRDTAIIWNEFHRQLYGFINKRVKDRDIANDILQDVFLKIHLKLNTLKDDEKLTSWIYQITRNSLLDFYKKQKPQAEISEDLAELKEDQNFNAEINKCLSPMINQLPEDARDAIMETELGNLSQKNYAQKLGISYSGAKSRVQRARKQLHDLFNECCKIESDKYGNVIEHECKTNCGCSS